MSNSIFDYILERIHNDISEVEKLVKLDDGYGLDINLKEIINYLEFNKEDYLLTNSIVSRYIITEGDSLSTLALIHDLGRYNGDYTLFINNNNVGINTYLVSKANEYYENNNLGVSISIDYHDNYNKYLDNLVNIIGDFNYVNTVAVDFSKYNLIIM